MAGRSELWYSPGTPSQATSGGREGAASPLDHMTVIGPRIRTIYPEPARRSPGSDPIYDRHARLFGDLGQDILSRLKVGIIGLGGGGGVARQGEWLARLGVGHIVAVDFDRIEPSNLPRVVGATRSDAAHLTNPEQFGVAETPGKKTGPA